MPTSVIQRADSLSFTDKPCREVLQVSRFEVAVRGTIYRSQGNRFSKELKREIQKLNPGETISFFNVRTKDRNPPYTMRLISDSKMEVVDDK